MTGLCKVCGRFITILGVAIAIQFGYYTVTPGKRSSFTPPKPEFQSAALHSDLRYGLIGLGVGVIVILTGIAIIRRCGSIAQS